MNKRLGLGCSKFGSLVNGVSDDDARTLIAAALDVGVRDFDTADIYGQGDSEAMLGRLLAGRDDVRIITKSGQIFTGLKRVAIPLKKLLRPLVSRRPGLEHAVAAGRAAQLPRDWSPKHLRQGLERSLRRLKRDHVHAFLLHGPTADILARGEAMDELERLHSAGMAQRIGVSVEDSETLHAALADPRVTAIQLPLSPAHPVDRQVLEQARSRGVELIAREITGGARRDDQIDAAFAFAAEQPIDLALIGTRRPAHLRHAYERIIG